MIELPAELNEADDELKPLPRIEIPKNYWDYCDNCGARMHARGCKYVCPQCGFFRSCEEP